MVIVSSFKLERNSETGIYTILSASKMNCPLCGGILNYRDRRFRKVINVYGDTQSYSLRRLYCETCGKLHTELPNIIQPYKHYDSSTIQNVIDETEMSKNCVADNSTISRWKASFKQAVSVIEQQLRSIQAQETDDNVSLVAPEITIATIKCSVTHWLSFVMQLLINNGHKLCTLFAFCPSHYSATILNAGIIDSGGNEKNDKTFKNSG